MFLRKFFVHWPTCSLLGLDNEKQGCNQVVMLAIEDDNDVFQLFYASTVSSWALVA